MARLAAAAATVFLLAACGSSKSHAVTSSAPVHVDGDIVFSVYEDIPGAGCGGLFAVDPASGRIRALAGSGAPGGPLQPSFSPDGRTFTVAFAGTGSSPAEALYRWDEDSGALERLTTSALPVGPAWSPQKDSFLVARGRVVVADLYVVDTAHSDERRIVTSLAVPLGYTWAAGGRRIAYTDRANGRYSVWTVDPYGNEARLVADDAWDPTGSPKGDLIAYWRTPPATEGAGPIAFARGDGADTRDLPGGPFLHTVRGVQFSPDGQLLFALKPPRARAKSDYGDGDLVVQDVRSTTPAAVVARNVIPVQWAPSGRYIIVLQPRLVDGETVFLVTIIHADGSNPKPVAVIDEQDVNGVLSFPAWQPGRHKIAQAAGESGPSQRTEQCVPRLESLRRTLSG